MMERTRRDARATSTCPRARRRSASRSASSTSPARPRARSARRRATLREVVDERKWRFDVEVREGDRTIGVGTHERRDRAARMSRRGVPGERPHPRGRPARRLPERARGDRRPTTRSRLIELLARTGLKRLEVTSFVRADVIPQLADGAEVLARIDVPDDVSSRS